MSEESVFTQSFDNLVLQFPAAQKFRGSVPQSTFFFLNFHKYSKKINGPFCWKFFGWCFVFLSEVSFPTETNCIILIKYVCHIYGKGSHFSYI